MPIYNAVTRTEMERPQILPVIQQRTAVLPYLFVYSNDDCGPHVFGCSTALNWSAQRYDLFSAVGSTWTALASILRFFVVPVHVL